MGGHELTPLALQALARQDELDPHGERMEYWIVGPNYVDSEKEFRTLYNDLKRLEVPFDKPGTYYDLNAGNMHISLWGGKYLVHAKSAAHPDSLVGEGLHGVILAEAAKLKPSVWSKLIRPTLADYRGWAFMTSTPEGKNWFYDMWITGQQGMQAASDTDSTATVALKDWWSVRAPSWSNPIVYPGGRQDPEILAMEQEMSAEKFNQEIGADFSEYVGRVFKDFDEELHVTHLAYNPNLPVYIAMDFGYTNPTVALFIQVDIWDNVYVIGEYYRTHRTAAEVGRDILDDPKLGPLTRRAHILYPDPEDPSTANELAKMWGVQPMRGTGGLLSDRLELIRRWLRVPEALMHPDLPDSERRPRMKIDFSCTKTIYEMGAYRYAETKNEQNQNPRENPLKKDDHAPEALGRFFAGHFRRSSPRGRAKQRRAPAHR
jgi:hypothetical protein